MSEELENSVREMLKSETWTRAGISNFTQGNLAELSVLLERAHAEDSEEAVREICDEQLSRNRNSIVALYLSGMIALRAGSLDNSSLVQLADIFQNNQRPQLVVQLCTSILEQDPQNKFALRRKAEYYRNEDPANPERWELYEKIVKLDLEEAEITRLLADHYDEGGDQEAANGYYRNALMRFVAARNQNATQELWTKLVGRIPEQIDFFLLMQKKVAKAIGEMKSADMMKELYRYYKNTASWDTAIDILKLCLSIDSKDSWARKELVDCFRSKYADHGHLEDYIKSSNLNQSFRNVFEAISDFEKHIAFDEGNYVFHRSWGVGKITKVQGDMLTINFGAKNGTRSISLKMAVSALQPLSKEHIWVRKARAKSREKLAEDVKKNVDKWLKIIIRSFDNKCDEKRVKAELVPSILTPGEWTSWHAKAQVILKTDPYLGINPDDRTQYVVRDHEMRPEERLSNEFKAEKDFFPRIDIMLRYMDDPSTDKNTELFEDMVVYFSSRLKAFTKVDEEVVASYLVAQYVNGRLPSFPAPDRFTFAELYADIESPKDMYAALKTPFLRDSFMAAVRLLPDWDQQFVELFPVVLKREVIAALLSSGKQELVQKLAQASFDEYRNYRDAAVYFFRECRNEEWFKATGIPYEKQLITLVGIISLCYREVSNHVNTLGNKKTIKAATQLLFAERTADGIRNNVLDYMLANEQDTITRLYTTINDVKDLDGTYKAQLRIGIQGKYPDFKFQEAEIKDDAPRGLMVTARMLELKKKEAEELEKVILPKIAEEVSDARAKGDLKENAEYSSAKERQHLENAKLARLKNEISEAVTFDPSMRTTSYVSFGTAVTLHDNRAGQDITYTILGPWESNPDAGIISYLSPFCDRLLKARVGETRRFSINENDFDLTVTAIAAAEI